MVNSDTQGTLTPSVPDDFLEGSVIPGALFLSNEMNHAAAIVLFTYLLPHLLS